MGFLLFEKNIVDGKAKIRPTGTALSLAGYNLLYRSWLAHGTPVDKGWHTSADELIKILTDQAHSHETRRLIIDFAQKPPGGSGSSSYWMFTPILGVTAEVDRLGRR